uniref:Variant surface glycoprotein 371 n=1 Tax=Trypanosoma brucei TaxID=5691 RepID=M4T1L4_9TRYP|nr:variant surface glycoprotein 371 [Trypanosoma brucei]
MLNKGRYLLIYLLAAVLLANSANAAAGDAIKKQYWTSFCDVAVEAETIASQAITSLEAAATEGLNNFKMLLKAQIYAVGNLTRPTSPEERMLWTLGAHETEKAFNYYTSAAPGQIVTAVRDAGRLQGAIGEWINLMAEGSDGTDGCLSTNDAGGNPISGRSALTADMEKCKLKWEPVHKGQVQGTLLGAKGLAGSFSTGVDHGNLVNGAKKCGINSPNTGFLLNDADKSGGGNGANVAGHTPKMAAGLLTIDTTGLMIEALGNTESKQATHPYLHFAVKAKANVKQMFASQAPATLEAARTSEELKRAARRQLLGKTDSETSEDDQLPNKIKSVFSDNDKYLAILHKNIDDMPIPKELTDDKQETTLGEINDVDLLISLYFHYVDANKRKLQNTLDELRNVNKKQESKSAEDKEKVCNEAGEDQQKCKALEKEGCVFNEQDKKCTLVKERKQALQKANQEAAAAETTTDKCKGKLEPECTKAPDCKSENNACKISSILVHKKLGLMAADFIIFRGILRTLKF